jgi:hypothetical protein
MTNYRCYRLKGGCYFFAVALAERKLRIGLAVMVMDQCQWGSNDGFLMGFAALHPSYAS